MVHQIETLAEFKEKVLEAPADKLVVVDFWATWCPPCRAIAEPFNKIAAANPDVDFYKVDVDDNTETTESQNIECMPTFKFFKNGEEVGVLAGASETKIKEMVASLKGKQ